jgi:hypothetical protein
MVRNGVRRGPQNGHVLSKRRHRVNPTLESLESRLLMTVSSNSIQNLYGLAEPTGRVAVAFGADDFASKPRSGRVLLGVQAHPEGDGFVPGSLRVSSGVSFGRDRAMLTYRPGSLATVRVRSLGDEAARFRLETYLIGDADGNGTVSSADLNTVQASRGARVGSERYQVAADSDRDGRITLQDLRLARRNLGASTPLQPLTMIGHDSPVDERLLTVLTEAGNQVEYLVDRDASGAPLGITGIREFRPDGTFLLTRLNDRQMPISYEDGRGLRIDLTWLESGQIRWGLTMPGLTSPVETVTDGIQGGHLMAASSGASTVPMLARTDSTSARGLNLGDGFFPGFRPIGVTVLDRDGEPLQDASVFIEYGYGDTDLRLTAQANLDPEQGRGVYSAIIPFSTPLASPRALDQAIANLLNDPAFEGLTGASCQFIDSGGLPALEVAVLELAAGAARLGPQASAAVLATGEAIVLSSVLYCNTIGKAFLPKAPNVPGAPSSLKDVLVQSLRNLDSQLAGADRPTTATVTAYNRFNDKVEAEIDPRLNSLDTNPVYVTLRFPKQDTPTFDNGVFITPGSVDIAGNEERYQYKGATWSGSLVGTWSVSQKTYQTGPDGARQLSSFTLTLDFDLNLPNTNPGVNRLTNEPGPGTPYRLFPGSERPLRVGVIRRPDGQFFGNGFITDLGAYRFVRGSVEGDVVRLRVGPEPDPTDLQVIVSWPEFVIEFPA